MDEISLDIYFQECLQIGLSQCSIHCFKNMFLKKSIAFHVSLSLFPKSVSWVWLILSFLVSI
jgi:hypothetical protein